MCFQEMKLLIRWDFLLSCKLFHMNLLSNEFYSFNIESEETISLMGKKLSSENGWTDAFM